MSRSLRRFLWTVAWLLVATAIALVFVFKTPGKFVVSPAPSSSPQTIASSVPATAPTAAAATEPAIIRTYGQLLHADLSNYPDTRPWATPVDLEDAAHLILNERLYVCPRGDLWFSRAGADPLQLVLARAGDETEHVADKAVEYVLWTVNAKGGWQAMAVCRNGNEYSLVSPTDQTPIPWHRLYRWDSAMNWMDNGVSRLIVPTDRGISVITIGSHISESYCDLLDSPAATRPANPQPQVLFDTRGLLAWIPCDGDFRGPSHVARFVDGKWSNLDAAIWPSNILHLVPMFDGHVLQIRRGEEAGAVELTIVPLDPVAIDAGEVAKLTQQLGDDDPEKRQAAFKRLTQFGPEVFAVLEKLQPSASLEAQSRIQELLDGKLMPTLGGMTLNENKLTFITRLPEGGVIFYAPLGVTIPQEQGPPRVVTPDYLIVQPGRPIQEVPEEIVNQLESFPGTITRRGDEWVVTDHNGPLRYLPPDQFTPILRPSEQKFNHLQAIDGRGRWILSTGATSSSRGPTLIIDPTVPDPTPRLAIWFIDTASDVGWSKAGWPVISMGKAHWVVNDQQLEMLDETTDKIATDIPAATASPPSSTSATNATGDGPLLLVDGAGNRYFGGHTNLIVVSRTGNRRLWTLPDGCAADDNRPVHLVQDGDGRLFLFNSASRIARLHPTPDQPQPLALDAVFSKNIPAFANISRAWLDPAGRIAVAYGTSHLAIIFPTGQVPPQIADQILPQDLKRSEP